MIDEKYLKSEERAIYTLRSLYRSYGYLPFKMSKFEEYDLYVRNKDFLVSDRIITFNDTNGTLMALKPDVTLSIIKNTEDAKGVKQKVCYDESVYRVSGSTHQYKEITQTGLECIGDIDIYDIYEVVCLAAKSLSLVSRDYALDISHLGILSALLDEICGDEQFKREIAHCVAEKNPHDTRRICTEWGVSDEQADKLSAFVGISGDMQAVVSRLEAICTTVSEKAALGELKTLCALLSDTEFASKLNFDFSIVNDMNYYNGIVFKGFLAGICEGVLSGGQYDKLMEKMGKSSGAVGFALYLDLLEGLERQSSEFDVDMLLLYDENTWRQAAEKVKAIVSDGKSVSAQRAVPKNLRYRELLDIREVL